MQRFNYPLHHHAESDIIKPIESAFNLNSNGLFEDEDLLVQDFVSQVQNSIMLTQGEYVSFPEERLSALIEENAMQKIETERLLEKLQ